MTREECIEEITVMAEDDDLINRITAGLSVKAHIDSLEQRIAELENTTIPFLTMVENQALRERIVELEAPKTCETCEYLEENNHCHILREDCSLIIDYCSGCDLYKPKESK